jgi:hypothetical protein
LQQLEIGGIVQFAKRLKYIKKGNKMLLWTKNRINEFKNCCEMQEPKSDILHALDLAALLEEALEHIVSLQVEVERLREGEECHVARPGEGTYECNINKPCPACRLRSAEERLKRLFPKW